MPAGVIDSIGVRLFSSNTGTVFLYSDNAGNPDLLITQSSSLSLNSGENICDVTNIAITAGDYWIGGIGLNVNMDYRGSSTSVNLKYKGLPYGTALPTNIGITNNYSGNELDLWSIICTVVPACNLTSALPTTAGTYTSTHNGTDCNYTYYCDMNNKLLLALDLTNTGTIITNNGVSIQIGNTKTTNIQLVYFGQNIEPIIVYPNPFSTNLNVNIETLNPTETAEIEIIDALGKVVLKQTTNQILNQLDLLNLSNGIYQLTIKTNNEI